MQNVLSFDQYIVESWTEAPDFVKHHNDIPKTHASDKLGLPEIAWEIGEEIDNDVDEREVTKAADGVSSDGRRWEGNAVFVHDELEYIDNIQEVGANELHTSGNANASIQA